MEIANVVRCGDRDRGNTVQLHAVAVNREDECRVIVLMVKSYRVSIVTRDFDRKEDANAIHVRVRNYIEIPIETKAQILIHFQMIFHKIFKKL